MGSGFRAGFSFWFSPQTKGDGFVFGIANTKYNNMSDCGGSKSAGEMLAWAGNGISGRGLRPPKIGLEFDIWSNRGASGCGSNSRRDGYSSSQKTNYNHLAWVFAGGSKCYATFDDNQHAAGSGSLSQPQNSYDIGSTPSGYEDGYYWQDGSNSQWLEDASKWYVRVEIFRHNATQAGTRCWELKAWLVPDSLKGNYPGIEDMKVDYNRKPDAQRVITLNDSTDSLMDNIQFGFTQATGAATQLGTIEDFHLQFRKDEVQPPDPLWEGLVSRWTFNEGTGRYAYDTGPSGNDGRFRRNRDSWIDGVACKGFNYDWNGQVLNVSHSLSLDLQESGTLTTWINIDEYRNYAGLIHKGDSSRVTGLVFRDETYSLQFLTNWFRLPNGTQLPYGREQIALGLYASDYDYALLHSNTRFQRNRWYHVAATWDATGMRLYVDGVLDNVQSQVMFPRVKDSGLNIGAQLRNGSYRFDGRMDETVIFNRALSPEEIALLAQSCAICEN